MAFPFPKIFLIDKKRSSLTFCGSEAKYIQYTYFGGLYMNGDVSLSWIVVVTMAKKTKKRAAHTGTLTLKHTREIILLDILQAFHHMFAVTLYRKWSRRLRRAARRCWCLRLVRACPHTAGLWTPWGTPWSGPWRTPRRWTTCQSPECSTGAWCTLWARRSRSPYIRTKSYLKKEDIHMDHTAKCQLSKNRNKRHIIFLNKENDLPIEQDHFMSHDFVKADTDT